MFARELLPLMAWGSARTLRDRDTSCVVRDSRVTKVLLEKEGGAWLALLVTTAAGIVRLLVEARFPPDTVLWSTLVADPGLNCSALAGRGLRSRPSRLGASAVGLDSDDPGGGPYIALRVAAALRGRADFLLLDIV
jgi:hypothetical protein